MGLGEARKRIEALEREVQSNPTPANMVSLVEKCMAIDDKVRALDWARRAVGKFPDSEKCVAVYKNVQRMRLERDIVELNQAIRRFPTRTAYEQLSQLYLFELGDRSKGYELALEGLSKFPDSDGLHFLCGQVRMDRFHADWLANDFMEATRHFERAAEVNPRNRRAALLLGRLFAEAGAYDRAHAVLSASDKGDQEDPQLERLSHMTSVRAAQTVDLDEALLEIEHRRGLGPEGLEVQRLFDPAPRGGTKIHVNAARIGAFLGTYESLSGYRASAVLTQEGYVVASHTAGNFEKERFVQLLQAVVRCCTAASRRMDIGTFVNGGIECPLGRISLAEWKNLIIGILADGQAKNYDLEGAIEKFISFASVS